MTDVPPTEPVVTPDPEFESDRGDWLVTCPHCLRVVFGVGPDEAMDAWAEHVDREHPHLPDPELHGEALLDALLDAGSKENVWAIWAVRDYWTPGRFTGAEFERLGLGHGGQDPDPDVITATDIVAVSMLDVNVPAKTARDLLGWRANEIGLVLSRVPDGPLHEVGLGDVQEGSPAHDLWTMVRSREQAMGPTTTSKLLARKRPHLLPVHDSLVTSRLGLPVDDWTWWWTWWANPTHVTAVEDLRRAASVEFSMNWVRDISLLRILDVAVWRYDVAWDPRPRTQPVPMGVEALDAATPDM